MTWASVDAAVADALKEAGRQPPAILAPTLVSPTLRRAVKQLAIAHGARVVEVDPGPATPSAALEARTLVGGRPLRPTLHLDRAELIVSLGADFLGADRNRVAHTRAYAGRPKKSGARRHVQIEGVLTVTGAAADERWRATSSEQRHIALSLLARIAPQPGLTAPTPADPARVDRLAAALKQARGRSLVVSGSNDLGEQVAVALINAALGNEGHTVDIARPSLVQRGLDAELHKIEAELLGGRLGGLIVLPGIDPVRQRPNGAAWAEAIAKLPLSVCLTDHATLTSKACRIVAASHHGLETWSDASPQPGELRIVQPTIRPLYATRDPLLSLAVWSGEEASSPLGLLKASWKKHVFPTAPDFDAAWRASLSGGRAEGGRATASLPPESAADATAIQAALQASAAPDPGGFEVQLIEEIGTGDGMHAHNAWLRELPEPLTRIGWQPVVRLSPAAAANLGVDDGDALDIVVGDATLTMAARILPGMHDRVLGVPVGFPKTNAFALATAANGRDRTSGLAAKVSTSGERSDLAEYQVHLSSEGRAIIHEVDAFEAKVEGAHHVHYSLWDHYEKPDVHWEMVIDLDACTGCGACVIACQAENNIPVVGPEEVHEHRDLHWLRLDRYIDGQGDDATVLFEPMLCQQCDHAPCETVCPVLATMHSSDGLNQQVYNRCVGTRYCANNCPYKMRRFNWFDYDFGGPLDRMVLNPDVVVRERGVMEKCTFCVQRIQASRIYGGEPQTACQQTCPANAIAFGNGADPESEVAKRRGAARGFQVLPELGVLPSVTYLARVRSREEVSS